MTATKLSLSQKIEMQREYAVLQKAYLDALLNIFKNQDAHGEDYARELVNDTKKARDEMQKVLKSHGMLRKR